MGGAAAIIYGEVDVDPDEFQVGRWPREITRMSNYNYPRLAGAITRREHHAYEDGEGFMYFKFCYSDFST
jgi:hypothetical protein